MSRRPGGETDKFGNRYEGAWTVRHILYVLLGNALSIKIEDVDELGQGAEFTYRRGDAVEVHQVKRQNGNANSWNVKSLHKKDIWVNARHHVEAGRHFHFVSVVPARPIQELTERARSADSLTEFVNDWLTKELKDPFDELSSSALYGSADIAWKVLRGLWVSWPDEYDLIRGNAVLAEILLNGKAGRVVGRLAAVGLGDLANYSLGSTLDSAVIESRLEQYGLVRSPLLLGSTIVSKVREITIAWAASVERELLQPVIQRPEADRLVELLSADSDKLTLLVGAAGGGKSATLYQAVQVLQKRSTPLLSFRLDRLEPFTTTTELGERIRLNVSPVAALAAVAGERSSVLIVDQVDAVSLVSGRMPRNFDAVADLVREASAFPKMLVLLVCRKFDVENDHRIRQLVDGDQSERVEVQELTEAQVDEAVKAMKLDPNALSAHQKNLLRSPLHLVLLNRIAKSSEALTFQTTKNLFDAFWQRKLTDCVQRRESVRFNKVISTLAEAISARQRLSVPVTVLDRDNLVVDGEVLVSEHILAHDGQEIAFFHEAFFDYAFARGWVDRNQSLLDFLKSGEQELFRRAQVRQILGHLRELEPERFVDEVQAILVSPDVRFHIKDVILTLLGTLLEPTSREWEMMSELLESNLSFEERLWLSLRRPGWFERLDAECVIEEWLTGQDESLKGRALDIMSAAAKSNPDRLAELLQQHISAAEFPKSLRWVTRTADIHESRPLFDLVLQSVRSGYYNGKFEQELWLVTHNLPRHEPAWAVELLAAYLIDRPGAMALDPANHVATLMSTEYSATELTQLAAKGAPEAFCALLLPYMLRVMEVSASEGSNLPIHDRHFSFRYPDLDGHRLGEALLAGMASSIQDLVRRNSGQAQVILEMLAESQYETAQWLLYEGLRMDGQKYAAWATAILLQGDHRFLSGYSSNGVWTSRQLIQVASQFCSDADFKRLESAILALRFPWEGQGPVWYMFNLLSGMKESRLSDIARRRLGELRRTTHMEQPPVPEGVTGGSIASPISQERASRMNDHQWLKAIVKHNADKTDWRTFTGGAHELSSVFRQEAERDPARFCALALAFDNTTHSSYVVALLLALGSAEPLDDGTPVFDAVRHIASLEHDDIPRWLGHALSRYYRTVPLDLVQTIVDQVNSAASDEEADDADGWSSGGEDNIGRDVYGAGINSVRGAIAVTLGDLLVSDIDGSRTALVLPVLNQLAGDSSIPVRSCAAHLIHASMRHARPKALEAFAHLISTDNDKFFAAQSVVRLIAYLGCDDPDVVRPVVERMLNSQVAEVQKSGGHLAAIGAMQWGVTELLDSVLTGTDAAQREGAARTCAYRLSNTDDISIVRRALYQFMDDPDKKVRRGAGEVALALRGQRLRPQRDLLSRVIKSVSFTEALPQLFITLEHAPDRVDELVLESTRRFIEIKGLESRDIRTSSAGEARYIGELLIRAYAQAGAPARRGKVLDLLDQLLEVGAFGVADLIEKAER